MLTEITFDADRRRNGPYTLAAELFGLLVPEAAPELVAAHDIEILAAAPGLRDLVPAGACPRRDRLPQDERILVPRAGCVRSGWPTGWRSSSATI